MSSYEIENRRIALELATKIEVRLPSLPSSDQKSEAEQRVEAAELYFEFLMGIRKSVDEPGTITLNAKWITITANP